MQTRKRWIGTGVLLAALGNPAFADDTPDVKTVLENAWKAHGGQGLKSLELTGSGSDFALGQAPNPAAPWPRFLDKSYHRVLDLETGASRLERVRVQGETPPRGGGGQPVIGEQKQTQIIAAGSAQSAALNEELPIDAPQSFLRAASLSTDATVTPRKRSKGFVLSFTGTSKVPVKGYLNDKYVLERVTTQIDNPVLGDTPFEADFSDYKAFDGIQFPQHIVQKQGGFSTLDLTITDVKINVPTAIAAPERNGSRPNTAAASQKLGDGIYLVTGGYASVLVEFHDYIAIIEGGQNEARSEAVIAEARRLFPGKPIQYIINTHAHFDHAGGLRTYVAEGATVITHQTNQAYFEKVWANPHTIKPDKLTQNPKAPQFKTVDDKFVLTDGTQRIELYHLHDFGHNDATLIAYLPKIKTLVEADGFNPPAQPLTKTPDTLNPFTVSLAENIARLKLDVETVIPIHLPADNRTIIRAELLTAAGKQVVASTPQTEEKTH